MEVVYFWVTIFKSSFSIPSQLSITIISSIQACFNSTFIWVAQASIEFSTNSFTIEKGLSTTSPAAIWLAKVLSNFIIFDIIFILN